MLKIIVCLVIVFYISKVLNIAINLWQQLPIKEVERDHPLYITKKL